MAAIVSSRINLLQTASPRSEVVGLGLGQVVDYSNVINTPTLGALAAKNTITSADITGTLSTSKISGLGALALINTVDAGTQVTNLGSLAFANSIAANNIGAGTLAAGVVYAGTIDANKINAGTINGCALNVGSGSVGVTVAGGTAVTNAAGASITNGVYIYQNNYSLYGLYCKNAISGAAYIESAGGYAIDALNTGWSGSPTTVDGSTKMAVHATCDFGTSIYGASSYGWAGYFQGNMHVTGNITCGGTAPGGGSVTYSSVVSALGYTPVASSGSVNYASSAGYAGSVSNGGNAVLNASYGAHQAAMQTDGNFVVYHGSTAVWQSYTSTSDARLKSYVTPTSNSGVNTLNALRIVDFEWSDSCQLYDGCVRHTGFIAQEVEAIIPNAVNEISGTKLLNQIQMIPYLVKAVQELSAEIESLKAQLTPGPV